MATPTGDPTPEKEAPKLLSDTPLCFACNELGTHKCADCGNARYCSERCQKKDWPTHRFLCDAFSFQEPWPSPDRYRGIPFPAESSRPKFVWLEYQKDRDARVDTERYLIGHRFVLVSRFHKLGRKLEHHIRLLRSSRGLIDYRPKNKCLYALLRVGSRENVENRIFLAHGVHGSPNDLDTSAIGPILDSFRYLATCEAARLRRQAAEVDLIANSDT
jgi:hypothetical protein